MTKQAFLILASIVALAIKPAMGADALECLISVYQQDADNKNVLLFTDSVTIVKDVPASSFLMGASVDIKLTAVDSLRAAFDVHIVTLGLPGKNVARRFEVEYDLPARISEIEVKPGAFYTVEIKPLRQTNYNEFDCGYNHNAASVFNTQPTANTDIYFLPSSLGDYYFSAVKDLVEREYRQFKRAFKLNLPGKYNLYLFPCPGPSVLWDNRFGTAIDPTRSNAYTLYSSGVNTADPFVIIQTALLRSYGYAPLFLSEGLANYFSFAIYEMKELRNVAGRPSPVQLLSTPEYLAADAEAADRISATFVRYLVDGYGYQQFMRLYKEADDLNLEAKIEQVYAKPIERLESEWSHYVDTLTIPPDMFALFAQRAEQMFNYALMLEYYEKHLEYAASERDSVTRLDQAVRGYFFNGDYYKATQMQEVLTRLIPNSARTWMALGTYRMISGESEAAFEALTRAQALDTTSQIVAYNLARCYLARGDTAVAARILESIVMLGKNEIPGESRIELGLILRNSPNQEDRDQATDYFTEALSIFAQQIQIARNVPTPYMWSGIALMGMNDPVNARDQLQLAFFLESRPFYLGMISLWLGKTADLTNNRAKARDYYGQTLSLPSAVEHQQEARRLLETPYGQ